MWSLVDMWYPGETNRGLELEKKNAELEKRRVAAGIDTPEWGAAQMDAFNANGPGTYDSEIAQAFADGAKEGLADMPGNVRSALGTGTGWTISFVPWWGWGVAAIGLFVWMGGADLLRGSLSRK